LRLLRTARGGGAISAISNLEAPEVALVAETADTAGLNVEVDREE
jgi:hypothetical protein